MDKVKYTLSYLPLFYDDLDEKLRYLTDDLRNVDAAKDLVDAVEEAILSRLPYAEAFEPYLSKKDDILITESM